MTHTITLVTDVYVSKTEALNALSKLLEVDIDNSDPSNAVVGLDHGVVLSIEVPKFGEDLPLTLDLSGTDTANVEAVALTVIDGVRDRLSWTVTTVIRS